MWLRRVGCFLGRFRQKLKTRPQLTFCPGGLGFRWIWGVWVFWPEAGWGTFLVFGSFGFCRNFGLISADCGICGLARRVVGHFFSRGLVFSYWPASQYWGGRIGVKPLNY